MTKTGLVGARDDSNIVSPTTQQVVVDLGELGARLSNLFTVNRSGNIFDRVSPTFGLNQVIVITTGAGSYTRIINSPAANCGAAFHCVCAVGAAYYAGIERFCGYPSSFGIGVEAWFCPVAYATAFDVQLAIYNGVRGDLFTLRYTFATQKLQAYTSPGPGWTDVATLALSPDVKCFYKLKLIVDPSNHTYNKALLNGYSYSISSLIPYYAASAEPPYLQIMTTSKGHATHSSKMTIGDVIVTQGEELTTC